MNISNESGCLYTKSAEYLMGKPKNKLTRYREQQTTITKHKSINRAKARRENEARALVEGSIIADFCTAIGRQHHVSADRWTSYGFRLCMPQGVYRNRRSVRLQTL